MNPHQQPDTAESWRQRGFDLVMRFGSPVEVAEARARVAEIAMIHRQTEKWMAERRRMAA